MSLKEKLIASLDYETCTEYGLQKDQIECFFNLPAEDNTKVNVAKEIIQCLLFQHSKDDLLLAVNDLSSIEESLRNIGIMRINIRDHVCHAVYTYCFGIYLIKTLGLRVNKFQWKLTSILHDVGYPVDIAMKLAKQLEMISNKHLAVIPGNEPEVIFGLRVKNLARLSTGKSAVTLITSRLRKWGFTFSAGKYMKEIETIGKVNHGVLGGVFVCKFIERLYRKNNSKMISGRGFEFNHKDWNYDTFYADIVDIATSILVHSLPNDVFTTNKINIESTPLPFLLRFADELQDWDRVSRNEDSHDPSGYDLDFSNSREIKITFPQDREHLFQNFDCFSGLDISFQRCD